MENPMNVKVEIKLPSWKRVEEPVIKSRDNPSSESHFKVVPENSFSYQVTVSLKFKLLYNSCD